jgi:uncharacterized protein (DUF1501 family)
MSKYLSRRDFLKAGLNLPALLQAPEQSAQFLPRFTSLAPYRQESRANVLVCIFLRGGMDGLNVVIPHADPNYYRLRPTLAIPEPTSGNDATAIDLDGFFGMHPSMRPLKGVWDDKGLAFIHAVGSPDSTQSHYEAMDYMEYGIPGEKTVKTGWLARHLQITANQNSSPYRAVGFGALLTSSLRGPVPAITLQSIGDFQFGGKYRGDDVKQFLRAMSVMYATDSNLGPRGDLTKGAVLLVEKVVTAKYQPSEDAIYPESEFGESMKQAAQLIKADVGIEVIAVDLGGWDTHVDQGTIDGVLPKLLSDLSAGLAAFYHDLGDTMKRVTVVAMSEFGRRVAENGGKGTDHGHGNVMFVMGKSVAGGKVYGQWPGISSESLAAPGDLAITTDFRSVLGELAVKHLLNPALAQIFPNFTEFKELGIAQDIT